ncbi:hypothetical protein EBB05_02710 [Methylobacterium brachiatum]|nr:hypothetical protein EBB05_02710 [Methylobacterium brachiatum]
MRPLLDYPWSVDDFESEGNQISGTLAHCIERLWEYVAASRHNKTLEVIRIDRASQKNEPTAKPRRICLYVHYNQDGTVADCDLELLRQCKPHFEDLIVVSNSKVCRKDLRRLELYATKVLQRENRGLDFAAWRDGIRALGWDEIRMYDEVAPVNNSCYGPIRPLDPMFQSMARREVDFWGVTSFPRLVNSNRPEAVYIPNRTIDRHLQSYWLVFRKHVVASIEFYRFFEEIEDKNAFMDVVATYETRLTKILSEAGFTWAAYVPDAEHLQKECSDDPRYNAPYNNPYEIALMGSPLMKKRAQDYNPANANLAREFCNSIGNFPAHLIDLNE